MTERRTFGIALVALAAAGLAIATYLTLVRVAGELPVCGPLQGCDTVALSQYSQVMGLPVALYGAGFSLAVGLAGLAWWRTGDRRALLGAYGLGLAGVLVVGYLTYLELLVIRAICVWCVAFGATVVGGWVVAAVALRRFREE